MTRKQVLLLRTLSVLGVPEGTLSLMFGMTVGEVSNIVRIDSEMFPYIKVSPKQALVMLQAGIDDWNKEA